MAIPHARFAAAAVGSIVLLTGATAQAAPVSPKEGHVTGDAWVRFPLDPQNPLRRFIFDAHGNAFRFTGGKMIVGDARGTVRFDHPESDPDGVVRHHWATVKVDYLMTAGPVAVVSGTSKGVIGEPDGTRMAFSVYADPRGHRYDRMGFSWGAVDGRCLRMGLAPAPFTTYASGRGYTVEHAELPAFPPDFQPPADPPPCTQP
ncbi:hypothetical protein NE236_17865 [Actinoallomurus purpureus]|uniref:hypothetical protein n=1 Tax=Actinoallomurus purpureus TaxID=478114 RepID=UPI002092145B|nr:hypothetical protein [Actinoallomurus purpureus]MCO6006856.1 hypothetical protein [Actinoallomurus purpureus]